MEYDSKKLLIIIALLLIWNYTTSKTKEIYFNTTKVEEVKIDQKQVELLARLIYSEAGGESYLGMLAVGNVVSNRMENNNHSLAKVIYQKGQFDGVRSSTFKYKYKKDKRYLICIKAATEILNGRRVLKQTIEFFFNPETSTDSKWIAKIKKYKEIQIDNHLFCHNPNLV